MTNHNQNKSGNLSAWDGFTRLFHWLLVCSMAFAWFSAEFSDLLADYDMRWHKLNGYFLLSLVIARIVWGFIGSSTSRFSYFVRPPAAAVSYLQSLRQQPEQYLSHNPAGAWMVVVLLGLLLVQAISGLFSSDDLLVSGPLASWVDTETSEQITGWHETLFKATLVLVVIHIAAVLFHQLGKQEPLIQAMFSGEKPPQAYKDIPGTKPLYWRSIWSALGVAVVIFLVSYAVLERV